MSLTITAVKQTGTWQGQNDLLYKMQVTLSDGVSGEVMATTPDRWNVGDEVEVRSRKDSDYGCKLKLGRPGASNGFGGGAPSGNSRGPQIEAQWAINAALAFCALNNQPKDLREVEQLAQSMLTMRDNIQR